MPLVVIHGSVAMLFAATVFEFPYGYYTLLRLVACPVFAYAALLAFKQRHQILPWCFVLLALAFNPIIKVHLHGDVWAVVDIAAGAFLLATSKVIRQKTS